MVLSFVRFVTGISTVLTLIALALRIANPVVPINAIMSKLPHTMPLISVWKIVLLTKFKSSKIRITLSETVKNPSKKSPAFASISATMPWKALAIHIAKGTIRASSTISPRWIRPILRPHQLEILKTVRLASPPNATKEKNKNQIICIRKLFFNVKRARSIQNSLQR